MKKNYVLFFVIVVLTFFASCSKKDADVVGEQKEGVSRVLSPEEQEKKITEVGNMIIANFKSADYKSLWELVDYAYGKFEEYDWSEYEELSDMSKYLGSLSHNLGVAASGSVTVLPQSYVFSMPKVCGVYTADDNTKSWRRTNSLSQNTIVANFTKNGTNCSVKVETSGRTFNIVSYWMEHYYESLYSTEGYYLGSEREDYMQPFEAVVPEVITVTITEGGTEHLKCITKFDMQNNSYFKVNTEYRISALTFIMDIDVKSTNCSSLFIMKQNAEELIHTSVEVPTYALFAKDNSESYEDYCDRYVEAYEKGSDFSVSEANAEVNLMSRIQVKAKFSRPVSLFREIDNIDEKYSSLHHHSSSYGTPQLYYAEYQDYNQAMADCFSNHIEAKMYYSSNVVQAELAWDVTSKTESKYVGYDYITYQSKYQDVTVWTYSPVMSFPENGAKMAFGDFFTSKMYNGFLSQIQDLCNSYIYTAKYLDIEPVELVDY